jgi:hypothetical protein
MDMQWPKVSSDGLLPLKSDITKVLTSEDDGTTPGSHESQLIQSSGRQLRELDAFDLSPNVRRQIYDFFGILEQIGQLWVCPMAWIVMLEGSKVFHFLERIIEWEIAGVESTTIQRFCTSGEISDHHV